MDRPCKCGGMNEECLFCGGTGLVVEKSIEIIKTVADKGRINLLSGRTPPCMKKGFPLLLNKKCSTGIEQPTIVLFISQNF